MPTPSWDLALVVFFLIGIAFGYILQREKIVATLLSVYVALVVTLASSGNVQQFLSGDKTINKFWIDANTSPFTIKAVIFLAIIVLISAKADISGGKAKGLLSPLEIAGYSIATTGLIMTSVFHFMPAETTAAFAASSRMAAFIINNYIWWVVLPVAFLILSGFFKKSSD